MATFRNRQSGETFEVEDDRAHLFAASPGRYEPVDLYPCEQCDRTFESAQGLASHSRSHEDG